MVTPKLLLFERAKPPLFEIRRHAELRLDPPSRRCLVDGRSHKVRTGKWMFFLPHSGEKFFYAKDGMIDSTYSKRPASPDLSYESDEWRTALTTPVTQRLAEIFVATTRLWKAGLGPKPLGITFVDQLYRGSVAVGATAGIIVQDVWSLPRKSDCSDDDVLAAGVRPDKIGSCTKQQLNGYVIDLNSLVGAQPIDAAEEVNSALGWISASRAMAAALD